jgi:hypothetical protein
VGQVVFLYDRAEETQQRRLAAWVPQGRVEVFNPEGVKAARTWLDTPTEPRQLPDQPSLPTITQHTTTKQLAGRAGAKKLAWSIVSGLLVTYAIYIHDRSFTAMQHGLQFCSSHKWFVETNALACDNSYYSAYSNEQILMWIAGVVGGLILAMVVLSSFVNNLQPRTTPKLSGDDTHDS